MRIHTAAFRAAILLAAVLSLLIGTTRAVDNVVAPPNEPASVHWNAKEGQLTLSYHGGKILEATLQATDADGKPVAVTAQKATGGDKQKVEQTLTFTPAEATQGATLTLRGTVTGSAEAFPAETESEAQERFPVVRNSVGLSRSLRNNAIYDRRWDWVLIGPADRGTKITPLAENDQQRTFAWESTAESIVLTFRPRFYQKHKGLAYFEPWTYRVWKEPVTGYCTWWPYRGGFNQKTLDKIVDVFAEKRLPDFGYRYVQIDDCFQTGGGSPRGFLNWNGKFPDGPQYVVEKIRSAGMEAGIWVFCVLYESDPVVQRMVKEHPDWFVRGPDGKVKRVVNPWSGAGFFALDTTNPDAVDRMVRPTYRGLKQYGFTYVKIDGAGDLVDWGYRRSVDYFQPKGATSGDALRKFYQAAREELGQDIYILTCWGVLPELIGVADGCRLATDGFRASSFQGFSSWEGVVWRNDPDHCDILPVGSENQSVMKTFAVDDAPLDTIIRPGVISMAGGVLLLSDKVEVYRDDSNLEGAKRSAPVLFTVPGQLHDYTPRGEKWSFHKDFRGYVWDGGGEAEWWLQEIDRPFDHWSVLARFNWRKKELEGKRADMPAAEVQLADLGLDAEREYVVFEFWTQKYLGKHTGSFPAPAMDKDTGMQVFAIREAREHPWPISTTRHLSQGGVSLSEVQWDAGAKTLAGTSKVVAEDPYVLTVHVPEGFKLQGAAAGEEKVQCAAEKEIATVRIVPSATGTIGWQIRFAK